MYLGPLHKFCYLQVCSLNNNFYVLRYVIIGFEGIICVGVFVLFGIAVIVGPVDRIRLISRQHQGSALLNRTFCHLFFIFLYNPFSFPVYLCRGVCGLIQGNILYQQQPGKDNARCGLNFLPQNNFSARNPQNSITMERA